MREYIAVLYVCLETDKHTNLLSTNTLLLFYIFSLEMRMIENDFLTVIVLFVHHIFPQSNRKREVSLFSSTVPLDDVSDFFDIL